MLVSRLRLRLAGFLALLAILVAVAVLSLRFIEDPIAHWLIFAGAALSAVPVFVTVIRLTAEIGRRLREKSDM